MAAVTVPAAIDQHPPANLLRLEDVACCADGYGALFQQVTLTAGRGYYGDEGLGLQPEIVI